MIKVFDPNYCRFKLCEAIARIAHHSGFIDKQFNKAESLLKILDIAL
jgi:hypothetical protein